MSATNFTGNVYGQRQGCSIIAHTYPVNFNTAGIATAIKVDTIKASVTNPVYIESSSVVITAFNALTTNVLTAGTTSANANEILAAGDITEGTPGFYPAANAVIKQRLIADTEIWVKYTQSGTAATTGAAVIIVKEYNENTKAIV